MSRLITPVRFGRQNILPQAPHEIRDEVEMYARESGRTGSVHFIPFGGWFVRLGPRCNDKALLLAQAGHVAEDALSEDVFLRIRNPYEGQTTDIAGKPESKKYPLIREMDYGMRKQEAFLHLDIYQMGASGVRAFLDKGNVESGRGEFRSIEDSVQKARERTREAKERNRAAAHERTRERVTERLRYKLRTFVGVISNIGRRAS